MINDVMNDADAKMGKSVEATREEFAAIRAGRANPAMFAKITADYYGTQTPLQQLASFTSQDARTILIQPFDMGAMGNIERAIRDSDPKTNPDAVKFDRLSYDEYLARDLKVADATGIAMARDNRMDIVFFNLSTPGTIGRAVRGEKIGTLVSSTA